MTVLELQKMDHLNLHLCKTIAKICIHECIVLKAKKYLFAYFHLLHHCNQTEASSTLDTLSAMG